MNEKELLEGIKRGNNDSYKALFDRFYPLLVTYTFKLTKDVEQARELVQIVFIRLYEKRKQLDIESFKPFLLKSVRNEFLMKERGNNRLIRLDFDPEVGLDEDHLVVAEEEARIWQAVNDLPDRCKEIFIMNRFDGLKNDAIASKLGISKRTVETQISNALKELRKRLFSVWITFL